MQNYFIRSQLQSDNLWTNRSFWARMLSLRNACWRLSEMMARFTNWRPTVDGCHDDDDDDDDDDDELSGWYLTADGCRNNDDDDDAVRAWFISVDTWLLAPAASVTAVVS